VVAARSSGWPADPFDASLAADPAAPITPVTSFRFNPLTFVILLSVALRLGAALYAGPTVVASLGGSDEVSYHTLAVRVTEGHGFTFATNWWPATHANQPTAHWSFLYVLFLAAVYTVAGPSPLAARLIQALVVGFLHPWLAWRIGNRLFGAGAGLASAAVTAVYGYFVYYAGALVTESLYIVAVLWVLDVATAFVAARRTSATAIRPWLWLGVSIGTATLLRQTFLLLTPIVLGWTAWQLWRGAAADKTQTLTPLAMAGRAAIPMLVVAAMVLPWTVRNYRAFGQLVPLNTNAGFVMFWANHPVHGSWFIPILTNGPNDYQTLLPPGLKRLNEAALDRELMRRGLGFVKDDPVRYLRLSASRAVEYFKFWPSADSTFGSNVARVLSFGLLLPLLVSGILIVWRSGTRPGATDAGVWLLLTIAFVYTLVHLLTWTLVRYRLPMDAVVIPFAGVTLEATWTRLRTAVPLWRATGIEAN
jgi:hypothetical protein